MAKKQKKKMLKKKSVCAKRTFVKHTIEIIKQYLYRSIFICVSYYAIKNFFGGIEISNSKKLCRYG